jgi:hypothetical protein
LPEALQAGCEWRYSWYRWLAAGGQTNNPYVQFRRVQCPSQLTDISGSVPMDDASYPAVIPADYISGTNPAPAPTPETTTPAPAPTPETTTPAPTPATSTPAPAPTPMTTTPSPTPATTAAGSFSEVWGQCGGINWQGPTQCAAGSICEVSSEYYSQCLPSSAPAPAPETTTPAPAPTPETTTPAPAPTPMTTTPAPAPAPETTTAVETTPSPVPVTTDGSAAGAWGQCGGNNWEGPTTCVAGQTCERQSEWYSQCLPTSSASFLRRKSAVVKVRQHLQK